MKLTFTDKLGYAAGGITDAANFTFMGSYLMFFLTTIAHINPATAGVLIAAGSVISSLWSPIAVSYTHLRAHETGRNLVCRLLLEKKKKNKNTNILYTST